MTEPRKKGLAEQHYDAVMKAHDYLLSCGFAVNGEGYENPRAGQCSLTAALAYLAIEDIKRVERQPELSRRPARSYRFDHARTLWDELADALDALDGKEKSDAGQ